MNGTHDDDFFHQQITAPLRAAEASVPVERTDDGWVISKGDQSLELTPFEMRRLVARVTAVQQAELRDELGWGVPDAP